jgi:hypothetical protein
MLPPCLKKKGYGLVFGCKQIEPQVFQQPTHTARSQARLKRLRPFDLQFCSYEMRCTRSSSQHRCGACRKNSVAIHEIIFGAVWQGRRSRERESQSSLHGNAVTESNITSAPAFDEDTQLIREPQLSGAAWRCHGQGRGRIGSSSQPRCDAPQPRHGPP